MKKFVIAYISTAYISLQIDSILEQIKAVLTLQTLISINFLRKLKLHIQSHNLLIDTWAALTIHRTFYQGLYITIDFCSWKFITIYITKIYISYYYYEPA